DFAFGHEQISAFQRAYEDAGGKVVKKLWPPLVTPDYTPFIAQIGNVDGVFHGFAGSNPVKFMRSYADLGLKGKVPLLAGWTGMDDALLKSLGDEAVGVLSAAYYSATADTPSNRRFVAAMQKDYGVLPGGYSAGMYVAGQCVEAAMQELDGKADDRKALAEALHRVALTDTPRGAVKFDQYGDQDLSEREPILELQRARVSGKPGLYARLSAGEEPRELARWRLGGNFAACR